MENPQPNDAAAQFIGVYVALTNYAKSNPPAPFRHAIAQAIGALAPLAADVLIQDKLSQQPAAPPAPEATKD